MEHGVPISSSMETLARTGSEHYFLRNGQVCRWHPAVPDTWTWFWTAAPCRAFPVLVSSGYANRRDQIPYLRSSLNDINARLVLTAPLEARGAVVCDRQPTFGLRERF